MRNQFSSIALLALLIWLKPYCVAGTRRVPLQLFTLIQPGGATQALVAPSEGIADLSISASWELEPAIPTEKILFTITVTNNGPDAADEAVFKFRHWENLELTEVSCGNPSNALCPIEDNSIPDLVGEGIVIPELANGGSLTFWVVGNSTGARGYLEYRVWIMPPEGILDPVADNYFWSWVYLGEIAYRQYLPILHQAQ
jgi:hypothetical protein